jgi:hypothetical protein
LRHKIAGVVKGVSPVGLHGGLYQNHHATGGVWVDATAAGLSVVDAKQEVVFRVAGDMNRTLHGCNPARARRRCGVGADSASFRAGILKAARLIGHQKLGVFLPLRRGRKRHAQTLVNPVEVSQPQTSRPGTVWVVAHVDQQAG